MPQTDDRVTEIFREVYEHTDAAAPDAPAWSTILKPDLDRSAGWRGPLVALAVAAVVLVVVGVTAIVAPWQGSSSAPVGGADVEGVVVDVYLADDIDAEQFQIVTEALTTAPGVVDWRYISKSEAYEEALIRNADNERYIEILTENPTILPASIRLLTANQTDAKAIEMLIREKLPMPTSDIMGMAIGRGTLSEFDLGPGYTDDSPFAALNTITEGWVAVVLLDDSITADQRQRVIDTLRTQRGVIEVLHVDKATALEEARILFAADPGMIRVLEEDPYLLPASIRVLTQAKRQADAIASTAGTLTGVIKTAVYRGALVRTDPLPPPIDEVDATPTTTRAD